MSVKKKLSEGDIFYVERSEKFIFGKILMDVSKRVLKKEPAHSYKFFSNCYLIEVYKGIYDTPELTTREIIIPGQFTFKKYFYSKNYKIDWKFYESENIDFKKMDFPENINNSEKGLVIEKFDLKIPIKISSFEELKKKYINIFQPTISGSFYSIVDNAFHFQGRDDLMEIKAKVFIDRNDLRMNPNVRKEIYDQINEPYDGSYYDLALKHGYDISRFYS